MDYATTCSDAAIDADWDARVAAARGGDLTQTTLWAASRRQLGFGALHVKVRDRSGALAGGCIVYSSRLAPGIAAGSAPRGPVLFTADPAAAMAVLRATIASARRNRIRLLVVQPPEGTDAVERAMDAAGFRSGVPSVAPDATLRLDLRRSDDELLQAMISNRRRSIQSGLRAGYAVGEEHDPELFHRLHTATAARQAFDAVTPGNIKAQWDCLASTGNCAMFVARRDGVAAGGIWLTSFAGTVTYKLAGWDASVKAPNANELLHWTAMQWARARGAHTYDLGGIDRTNAERLIAGLPPAEGFERTPSFFKQRFGGAPVLLPRARFVFTNGVLNAAGGWAAQRALSSDMLHRLANRLRNGRS